MCQPDFLVPPCGQNRKASSETGATFLVVRVIGAVRLFQRRGLFEEGSTDPLRDSNQKEYSSASQRATRRRTDPGWALAPSLQVSAVSRVSVVTTAERSAV